MSASEIFEAVNRYGFAIIFAIAASVVIYKIAIAALSDYKDRRKAALEMEQKDHEAQLEQQQKMYALVTDIQSQQIVTLEAINKSLDRLVERQESDSSRMSVIVGQIEHQSGNMGKVLDKCVEIMTVLERVEKKIFKEGKENGLV
jgi:hypothetical protein